MSFAPSERVKSTILCLKGRQTSVVAAQKKSAGFGHDLAWSLSACLEAPALPLLALGQPVGEVLPQKIPAYGVYLNLALLVVGLGFLGTQRIWFLRLARGAVLRMDEIWPLTRAFILRMVVLAMMVALLLLVVGVGVGTVFGRSRAGAPPTHRSFSGTRYLPLHDRVALLLFALAVDVALTFVVPDLVFVTRRVPEALRSGVRMIGSTWPASAWYVLTPGIAATLVAFAVPDSLVLRLGSAVAGGLLAVWFRGAIVAFFLRAEPKVGSNGAAYAERRAR